jgi:sulfhydrogenase subunit beta (sulfur reductase)
MRGLLDKDKVNSLAAAIMGQKTLLGPVRKDRDTYLGVLGLDSEILLDYGNFKLPPKRHFFPQSEIVFTYDDHGVRDAPPRQQESVLFGIRPCDTRSLRYLDLVFVDEKHTDPFYRARRESTTIITLTCSDPTDTCFCTSVGGGPGGADLADVLVTDLGRTLLFESCSERGEALLTSVDGLLQTAAEGDVEARRRQIEATEKSVRAVVVGDMRKKLAGLADSPIWDETALRCLSCGACSFTCPTCHCFGFYDDSFGSGGRRIKVQDACVFPSFALEASGHNPRNADGRRMRQRMMHKFSYSVDNFGETFCVGCGRCIANCPVNIDVRETIAEVQA